MKGIIIKVLIEGNQMATGSTTKGYSKENISDQLEILGIFENLVEIQKEKIKTFRKIKQDN